MKKRLLSFALALACIVQMCVPALAVSETAALGEEISASQEGGEETSLSENEKTEEELTSEEAEQESEEAVSDDSESEKSENGDDLEIISEAPEKTDTYAENAMLLSDPSERTFHVASEADMTDAMEIINAGSGKYEIYLDGDIDFVNEISLTANTLTVYGEGHTMSVKAVNVSGSACLNLGSDSYEKTLTIKSNDDTRGIAYINDGQLNMYNNVTLGPSVSPGTCAGVTVSGTNSKFTMNGGKITECTNLYSISGGVNVASGGQFFMNDGIIEKCTGITGGAVALSSGVPIGPADTGYSKFTMAGGTIKDCKDLYYGGGAVACFFGRNTEFEMTGGTIENCSAEGSSGRYGGGVFFYTNDFNCKVSLKGGTITNCSAGEGGALFISGCQGTVSDQMKIYNNTAANDGDDIYVNGSARNKTELILGNVPEGLVLAETDRKIDGWYEDGGANGEGTLRWAAEGENAHTVKYDNSAPIIYSTAVKAAHSGSILVEFDLNGGEYEDKYAPVEKSPESSIILPEAPHHPEGFEFKGWLLGDESYEPGSEVTLGKNDAAFKAQWVYTWTVSFSPNGGSGEMESIKVVRGQNLTLPKNGFTAPKGMTFDGWSAGSVGEEIAVEGDMVIEANWKKKPGRPHHHDDDDDEEIKPRPDTKPRPVPPREEMENPKTGAVI